MIMGIGLTDGQKGELFDLMKPGEVAVMAKGTSCFFPELADKAIDLAAGIHSHSSQQHVLYDPFCGNGTILGVAATLYKDNIRRLIGSDVNAEAVNAAQQNIDLTSAMFIRGLLEKQTGGVNVIYDEKVRHKLAHMADLLELNDCHRLSDTHLFQQDILKPIPSSIVPNESVSMVVTDPPHGNQVPFMVGGQSLLSGPALNRLYPKMLATLRPTLQDGASVALICDTQGKLADLFSSTDGYAYQHSENVMTHGRAKQYKFRIHLMKAA